MKPDAIIQFTPGDMLLDGHKVSFWGGTPKSDAGKLIEFMRDSFRKLFPTEWDGMPNETQGVDAIVQYAREKFDLDLQIV